MSNKLFDAVERCDIRTVRKLLKDPRQKLKINDLINGVPALCEAVCNNDAPMIKLLLTNGADPNCKTVNSIGNEFACKYSTAFHQALLMGSEYAADLFLNFGVNVNLKNYCNETALHYAAAHCSRAFIEKLLNLGAKADELTDQGETALHWLLRYHRLDTSVYEKTRLLVSRGISVTAVDCVKRTALYNAVATKQSITTLEYLIANGARVNECGECVPIRAAISNGDMLLFTYLIGQGARVDFLNNKEPGLLQLAIENSQTKHERMRMVEYLVSNGISVNHRRDAYNWTALQLSIQKRDLELFKYLLENGAIIHEDYVGLDSPLSTAVRHNFVEAASILINLGTPIGGQCNGKDLLAIAISNCSLEAVKLLLDNRAAVLENHYTIAITFGIFDIISLLLERCVDCNTRRALASSALIQAIQVPNPDIVNTLLRYGADVNCRDKLSRLPVAVAQLTHQKYTTSLRYGERARYNLLLLTKHVKLLSFRGMLVDAENHQLIESSIDTCAYYQSCQEELETMLNNRICADSCTTYFHILTKRGNALANCLRNDNVAGVLKTDDYRNYFPIYSDCLQYNYVLGCERLEMVDKFCEIMHPLLDERLPLEVVYKISEYFNNAELRQF